MKKKIEHYSKNVEITDIVHQLRQNLKLRNIKVEFTVQYLQLVILISTLSCDLNSLYTDATRLVHLNVLYTLLHTVCRFY
jgi:hypothetical protein